MVVVGGVEVKVEGCLGVKFGKGKWMRQASYIVSGKDVIARHLTLDFRTCEQNEIDCRNCDCLFGINGHFHVINNCLKWLY